MTDSRNDIGAPYPQRRIMPGQEPWLLEALRRCGDYIPVSDIRTVIDMVEPMIRADEREQVKAEYRPVLMEHLRILADLRAQVEALRSQMPNQWVYQQAITDVLALFARGSGG